MPAPKKKPITDEEKIAAAARAAESGDDGSGDDATPFRMERSGAVEPTGNLVAEANLVYTHPKKGRATLRAGTVFDPEDHTKEDLEAWAAQGAIKPELAAG